MVNAKEKSGRSAGPTKQETKTMEAPAARAENSRKIESVSAGKSQKASVHMSPEQEKASVFEIISDLEKQLEAAFAAKEASEHELAVIKDRFSKSDETMMMMETQLKELRRDTISQKELNSEVNFLETERLESLEKIKGLEEEVMLKDAQIKEVETKMKAMAKELEVKNGRIEQVEYELASVHKNVETLQNQIALHENEKDELLQKIEDLSASIRDLEKERDKAKRDFEEAKENMEEIRLMLAETRTRTRSQYYKNKKEKTTK